MNATSQCAISAVVPVLNEAESLPELVRQLDATLGALGPAYEMVFVDDGSTDASAAVLRDIGRGNPRVRTYVCRRNFGKSTALDVGFCAARGDVFVTLDADLQDDPAEIPALLAKLDEGPDMVVGWKVQRQDAMHKTLASRVFNLVVRGMSGPRLHDMDCGLKVLRREVAESIPLYGELHRFFPLLAHWQGFRIAELPVRHHPRRYGRSKYGAERFLRGAFDFLTVAFITKYAARPMHLFGKLGLGLSAAGFATCAYLVALKINGEFIGHRPLLTLGVLLLIVGVLFFSTGLLGEMMLHLHKQGDRRVARNIVRDVYDGSDTV